ncbi:MAG TPA: WxL domain-containing protein, partial [Tissierellaceae bacterium]
KVGDTVSVKLTSDLKTGLFVYKSIEDLIPDDATVVKDSTYVYYSGDEKNKEKVDDSKVWLNNKLSLKADFITPKLLLGDDSGKNSIVVEYKFKVSEKMKGKVFDLNIANLIGENKYGDVSQKEEYSIDSNLVNLKVMTDIIFNFNDREGNVLDSSFIVSSDKDFNSKNPVVIYLNTGDSYDYTTQVNEINRNLKDNKKLVNTKVSGDIKSSSAPEQGEVINLEYSSKSLVKVVFVNEADQTLDGYTINIDTEVGNTLNLEENAQVKKTLEDLISAGYEISEKPSNAANYVVNDVSETVTYKIKGIISLSSIPTSIDFGKIEYSAKSFRVEDPVYDNKLEVTDTRANASDGWVLTATLTKPMTNASGDILKNALVYVDGKTETVLNASTLNVYKNSDGRAGVYNITDKWGNTSNSNGLKLQVYDTDVLKKGDYQGEVTWNVIPGQP